MVVVNNFNHLTQTNIKFSLRIDQKMFLAPYGYPGRPSTNKPIFPSSDLVKIDFSPRILPIGLLSQ